MSAFIKHEGCPECGSKDNVGVWTDGKYCFGCGWFQPVGKLLQFKKKLQSVQHTPITINGEINVIRLPTDFNFAIPLTQKMWLHKYDLTEKEIRVNKIGWSFMNQYLIFPIYDKHNTLLMWVARNFKTDNRANSPKYITIGKKGNILHILGNYPESNTLVLVEDLVSAIKIARIGPTMPLFGAILSREQALNISKMYKNIVFWLDKDKHSEAIKQSEKFAHVFDHVGIVSTPEDPKELRTVEARNHLKWYIDKEVS